MLNDALKNLQPILAKNDLLLDSEATAANIVNLRKLLNISQKALAMEMGISQPFLSDLLRGHRRWSLARFNSAKAALERLSK